MGDNMFRDKKKKRFTPDIPPIINAPCLEFSSNREVVIEGSKGVVEYSGECIRINTADVMLSFFGRELDLKCISESALIIAGYITKVEFTA